MKIFSVVLLVSSLLLTNTNALAQQTPLSEEDMTDEQFDTLAYQKTTELCKKIATMSNADDQINVSLEFLEYAVHGLWSGIRVWRDDSLSISDSTSRLVKSDGFQAAVSECYSEPRDRKLFTGLIIGEDAGGHLLGFLALGLPLGYVSKLFLASQFALANPQIVKGFGVVSRAASYLAIGGLVALTTYDGYQQYDMHKNASKYLDDYNNQMLKYVHEESQRTYQMILDRLAQVNERLETEKDPIKIRNLLYLKSLLEERVRAHQQPDPDLNVPPK